MIYQVRKILLFTFLFAILLPGENFSQYYFGRNKIQYNQFDWQVMETEHFNIFFYPEMEELATVGAKYAEDAYKILRAKFDHTVSKKIPLIFYSSHFHFQETNVIPNFLPEGIGGFFEFIKGRVVIPANGSLWHFHRVIQHELVHVFTHSKINRLLKDNKKMDWGFLPLWFTEGLAEYWSVGWDSQSEMFLRDAVINNYIFPLERIYQISGSFLMYKEGQAVCRFIAKKYGEDKLLQIFENFWKVDRFSQVLKLTIGKNYRELDEEWIYDLKKKHYPLLKDGDIPGKVAIRLTQQGFNTKPAFYQKDGEPYLVFHSNRTGYSGIYTKNLKPYQKNQNKPQLIITGERTSEFESFHLFQSKMDVSKNNQLVFISKSDGRDAVYIYNLSEERMIRKLQFDDLIFMSSPNWDSTGQKIAFSAIDFAGKNDLYVVNLSDEHITRLTNDLFDDKDPSWSPDGSSLVFSSDRTEYGDKGAYNLFQIDINSLSVNYITHGNFIDNTPVWSPDGEYIAFTSDRDSAFNVWAIKAGSRYKYSPFQLVSSAIDQNGDSNSSFEQENYFSVIENAANDRYSIQPPELKKITNYITGAFDPEWTENGNMIFTAFENFSFQLRKLDDIKNRFEAEQTVGIDRLAKKGPMWIKSHKYLNKTASSIKYKKKFSLDIAQSYVTQDPIFGTYGGAQLMMSDILGNQQYYFLIYNDATSKDEFLESFNVSITKLDLSRRINLSYGVYHFAGRFFNFYDGFFYERRYGGFFGLSYPLSVFNRIEASVNVRNSDKEWFNSGFSRRALMISNYISYVKDNSLWGPTGPLDGNRFNLTIGNTVDIQYSNVNFYTVILDYRYYYRLSNRVTFATRSMGSFNIGKETIKFVMGGSWDLRGYNRWSIWGEKLLFFSQELRFPFIDQLAINFPFGGLGFSSIRGALFWDNGNAWNGEFTRLFGSYGVGARMNLGGFLVLRLDYGKKYYTGFDQSIFKPTELTLEPGTFTQFFFGWDF